MDILNNIGVLFGGSWASGVNLYLTVSALGIANRMGIVELPGELGVISNPLIIGLAVALYLVEFVADKVPLVDSAWDSVHTFVRPLGGAAMAYMGAAEAGPLAQYSLAMLSGSIALDSHMTKATARAAINTSPEPFTNSAASITEDSLVLGVMWMIVHHPVITVVLVILFILFSIWFIKTMFRFVRGVFRLILGGDKKTAPAKA